MALSSFRPSRILSRHYRSQHESLIAFSNYHFYGNELKIFPSPIKNPDELGVRLEYVGGTYASNSNMDEVEAVVKAALEFMRKHPDRSLGIATMNQVQKDLIEIEMDRAFIDHPHAANYKAKWQGTLESFFVKNLESVQGDERDAIFISTVYGPDKNDTFRQSFGPINRAGGYRRLNVLFSRAKKNMVVFTSIQPERIAVSETSSDGVRALKGFLTYAAKGIIDEGQHKPDEIPDSDFEIWVKEKLEAIGCEVHPQVGVAGYRIDLGVKHPKYPYGYLMGVECDGATYHSSKSARERDVIRQQVLEGLGWRIYRIWSTDWFSNPVQEFEKLKNYIQALLDSDDLKKSSDENKVIEHDFTPYEKNEESEDLFDAADKQKNTDNMVQLFDNVTYFMVKDGGKKEKRAVQIVPTQGDPHTGTIAQHSVIGRALLGCCENDEVEAVLPIGEVTLIIDKIIKAI
ncbi:MAG: GreA/GreB family elongation factor [Rhodospirillales bacterium]|nr:GreA/GreB family elongation factor [Rhodospirillales bacterium]